MADDAQPPEGQGADAQQGIFDSYLQTVPEDGRQTVEAYLKDASKHVDGRLQEAAQMRKQFEPYTQVEGLDGYQPDQLAQLLAWHQQVTQSEEAFKEWLTGMATEQGLLEASQESTEPEELTREDIQALAQQLADERVSPIEAQLAEFQQERLVAQTETQIRDTLDALHSEHGDFNEKAVLDLALNHEGDDWLQNGFRDYQEIAAQAQRDFVTQKTAQPDTPLTGGGTPALKATTDWKEAGQQALARLRQQT